MGPDGIEARGCRGYLFGLVGSSRIGPATGNPSTCLMKGGIKRSEGFKSIGRTLRLGVSRVVFPEDLNRSERKIFDPQDRVLLFWNRLCVVSCILAVYVDPFFFYLPIINNADYCLGIDDKLAVTATTLRTAVDAFYIIHMIIQFRTAYIAPSSRVFGRGELVIDPTQIAMRYLRGYFIIDFLAILPLPQIVVWRFLDRIEGSNVLATKQALFYIVLIQYIPRLSRIFPLTSELKRTSGVFAQTAWAGAVYYLILFMLASHIVGALWYLQAVERNDSCWKIACDDNSGKCDPDFLYCGSQHMRNYNVWSNVSEGILNLSCNGSSSSFDYGIYSQAVSTGIFSSTNFFSKYCYCLWWGLQNLSTLGQGLQTSTYPTEVIFSILLVVLGLVLFALLIGNMQTYLQSLTLRLEEMRVKRRDSDQWMHNRLLPRELRERVRRYDHYKWLETRGVDEESLVENLPKDLRRDIKRHLCLDLVRRVPLFEKMEERLLDAICERLKPRLYTEETYIVKEGDPVEEMMFIIRGRLESMTTDGGRTGFFNRSVLKEGEFCGEELLTWALDPKSGSSLPCSTRTVRALTEVEAFSLAAEELRIVAGQFRRLHSKQVQHTFRFYSQQWRTWAACFIQVAWRRHIKKRNSKPSLPLHPLHTPHSTLGAAFFASKFAANALRSLHRIRQPSPPHHHLFPLNKPPEPDFSSSDFDPPQ